MLNFNVFPGMAEHHARSAWNGRCSYYPDHVAWEPHSSSSRSPNPSAYHQRCKGPILSDHEQAVLCLRADSSLMDIQETTAQLNRGNYSSQRHFLPPGPGSDHHSVCYICSSFVPFHAPVVLYRFPPSVQVLARISGGICQHMPWYSLLQAALKCPY